MRKKSGTDCHLDISNFTHRIFFTKWPSFYNVYHTFNPKWKGSTRMLDVRNTMSAMQRQERRWLNKFFMDLKTVTMNCMMINKHCEGSCELLRSKTLEYRTGRKRFFFQASSGIRMDQNKGFLPVLYSMVFDVDQFCHYI